MPIIKITTIDNQIPSSRGLVSETRYNSEK